MNNFCFIGNSHLAAVANAWNNQIAPQYPMLKATFFAGPRQTLHQAQFSPTTIKAVNGSFLEAFFQKSAKKTIIEIAEYDVFIFQGLDFLMMQLIELAELLNTEHPEHEIFYSSACVDSTLESIDDLVKLSAIKRYCEHIRRYSDAPILVSIAPKTSILALEKHPEDYTAYLKHAASFEKQFLAAQAELLIYPNLTIIPQPQQTLANPYFTKFEYSAKYGTKTEDIDDYRHKNNKYGAAVLAEIFKHLEMSEVVSQPLAQQPQPTFLTSLFERIKALGS